MAQPKNGNPRKYGGFGLVSIYVTACQSLLLEATPFGYASEAYSTVTDFARLRGWSTSVPLSTAT